DRQYGWRAHLTYNPEARTNLRRLRYGNQTAGDGNTRRYQQTSAGEVWTYLSQEPVMLRVHGYCKNYSWPRIGLSQVRRQHREGRGSTARVPGPSEAAFGAVGSVSHPRRDGFHVPGNLRHGLR